MWSEYLGFGAEAEREARAMEAAAGERRAQRDAIQADRVAQVQFEEALQAQDRLIDARLATEGIHCHRGEYRRIRRRDDGPQA